MMDGCTFKPNVSEHKKKPLEQAKNKNINGYDKVVERYRTAADEKKRIQQKIDKYKFIYIF